MIREAVAGDADALGLITVSASLATFLGRIPEELLDLGWRPEDSADGWRRTMRDLDTADFVLVNDEDSGQIAGFVWAGPSAHGGPEEGEIKGLYVLPSRQRAGLGRALVAAAVQRLLGDGRSALVIGCMRENPSCGFYRHLGGTEAFRRPNTVDRHVTEEIFFRWPDMGDLVG